MKTKTRRVSMVAALSLVAPVMLCGALGCSGEPGEGEVKDDPAGQGSEALSAPTSLTVAKTSAIRLSWVDRSSDELGFIVKRGTLDSPWITLMTVGPNVTSFMDRTVIPDIPFKYRIAAYKGAQEMQSSMLTAKTAVRRPLSSLSLADQEELAKLIRLYLTDAIVHAHMSINHATDDFFRGHRTYLQDLEDYILQSGRSDLVPLPFWDPATPIPAVFQAVKSKDDNTARAPLVSMSPNRPLDALYKYPKICDQNITSLKQLRDRVINWHVSVHDAVGGTMADNMESAASLIFQPFHGFVDTIWADWQRCSISNDAASPSSPE